MGLIEKHLKILADELNLVNDMGLTTIRRINMKRCAGLSVTRIYDVLEGKDVKKELFPYSFKYPGAVNYLLRENSGK